MTNVPFEAWHRAATMTGPPVDPSTGRSAWSDPINPAASAASTAIVAAASLSDDQSIVASVLGGDADAYRVLVDREAAAVVRACLRIVGDAHEAEDLAQEAFVIAYRSLGSWRADGPFGAWLSRIAVRLALRQAGRRRPVAWIDPTDGRGLDGATEQTTHLAAGPATDPERAAIHGERQVTLHAAVAALEEPYRETIALRFFAERSLEEIASITGRPLGTVKTHLRRGLIRLRSSVEPGTAS